MHAQKIITVEACEARNFGNAIIYYYRHLVDLVGLDVNIQRPSRSREDKLLSGGMRGQTFCLVIMAQCLVCWFAGH